MEPLCVLDFYVHEAVQRGGHGRALFELLLSTENKKPHKLAYDRPSFKYINFLAKYYGLNSFVKQNNNFVVFDDYFEDNKALATKMRWDLDTSQYNTKTTMMTTQNK